MRYRHLENKTRKQIKHSQWSRANLLQAAVRSTVGWEQNSNSNNYVVIQVGDTNIEGNNRCPQWQVQKQTEEAWWQERLNSDEINYVEHSVMLLK